MFESKSVYLIQTPVYNSDNMFKSKSLDAVTLTGALLLLGLISSFFSGDVKVRRVRFHHVLLNAVFSVIGSGLRAQWLYYIRQ